MAATHDSGLGYGSKGHPQTSLEENIYAQQVNKNASNKSPSPIYHPSPKHDPSHNWGSENPIKTSKEGQYLLDTGYKQGRQIYNITVDGVIVKFQPDNSPDNGYHAYKVSSPRDIPASILKKLRDDGKISPSDYNKYRKGKK